MDRKRISIVGVGLIGGSLAIQLNEKVLPASSSALIQAAIDRIRGKALSS